MGHGVHGHTTPPKIDAALARTVAERMQMLATPSRVQILGQLIADLESVMLAIIWLRASAVRVAFTDCWTARTWAGKRKSTAV